jgi:hypothetical protein
MVIDEVWYGDGGSSKCRGLVYQRKEYRMNFKLQTVGFRFSNNSEQSLVYIVLARSIVYNPNYKS